MIRIVRVKDEIEFLKPRLEEILARATTLFNARFPSNNIEETCDNAQDTLDILQHRTQKYSDAFREFRALADTIAEDDGLFQWTQGAMLNLLLDAEEMALRLDRRIKRYLKDYLERQRKHDRALADELERKRDDVEAEKAGTRLEMKRQPEKLVFPAERPEKVSASAERPEVAIAVEQPEKVGVVVEEQEETRMRQSKPPRATESRSLSRSLPSMRATLNASPANPSSAISASGYPIPTGASLRNGKLSANRAPIPMRKASYSYNKQIQENQEAHSSNEVHSNSGGSRSTSSVRDQFASMRAELEETSVLHDIAAGAAHKPKAINGKGVRVTFRPTQPLFKMPRMQQTSVLRATSAATSSGTTSITSAVQQDGELSMTQLGQLAPLEQLALQSTNPNPNRNHEINGEQATDDDLDEDVVIVDDDPEGTNATTAYTDKIGLNEEDAPVEDSLGLANNVNEENNAVGVGNNGTNSAIRKVSGRFHHLSCKWHRRPITGNVFSSSHLAQHPVSPPSAMHRPTAE